MTSELLRDMWPFAVSDAGRLAKGWDPRQHFGWRADLLERSRRLLCDRGHAFIGESAAPHRVDVQVSGTAILATLWHPNYERRIVLKPTSLNRGIRDACELAAVLGALAASCRQLGDGLPRVLGGDERTGMLVTAYVEGEHLVSRMRRSLRPASHCDEESHEYFRQAARMLAAAHRVPAGPLLPSAAVRTNGSFVRSFEATSSTFRSVFQAAGFDTPGRLLNRLSSAFFSRRGDRVLLIDARPKNAIIRTSGTLCFIDLDCAVAPQALGVASFLVSLDRLAGRYPHRVAQARVVAWQRTFVQAYFACEESSAAEDLTFFYPWTLLQMFEQHRTHHPSLAPYLRWHYGRCLSRYLVQLGGLADADIARSPAELFGTDSNTVPLPLPESVVSAS